MVVGPTGPLDFSLVMSDLGLGAVVTAPVSTVGVGLEELPSPGGGNPCLLAKPSCKMATVESTGSDLGGALPENVHGEVTEYLSTWFVGTIQVLVTSFAHASGMTKMFQSMSRNSSRWCFGAT